MSLKYSNNFSNWITKKELDDASKEAGLKLVSRKRWVFFKVTETALNREIDDALPAVLMVIKLEAEACLLLIRAYLLKFKGLVGVECKDGIFLHPEVFGKVIMKLGKRYS